MSNPLTLTSPVYDTSTPKFGSAALSSGYGLCGGPIFTANTNQYTLEGWFKTASAPASDRVLQGQNLTAAVFMGVGGIVKAKYGNGGTAVTIAGATNYADGLYHHYAFTIGPEGGTLFVDGVSVATSATSWATSVPAIGSGFYYGVRDYATGSAGTGGGSNSFNGSLDEHAVWSGRKYTTTFTPPVAPYVGNEANLLALWHLNSSGTDALGAFAAGVGTTTIPADNAAILYSPANWVVGSGVAKAINPGAYLRTSFQGNSLSLGFTIGTAPQAKILVKVDDREVYRGVPTSTPLAITMPADTTNLRRHTLEIILLAVSNTLDTWTTPVAGLVFTGFTVQTNAVLKAPTSAAKKVLVFGDDIAQGNYALGKPASITTDTDYHDAAVSFAFALRRLAGVEVGMCTFNRQGYKVAGLNNVPALETAYANIFAGQARSWTGIDYILFNQGFYDTVANGTTTAAVTAAVTALINALLAVIPATCKIGFLRPINGNFWGNIQSGITAVGSKRVFIHNDTTLFDVLESDDETHPNPDQNMAVIAPPLASSIATLLYGPQVATLVGTIKDSDLINVVRDGVIETAQASILKTYLASVP